MPPPMPTPRPSSGSCQTLSTRSDLLSCVTVISGTAMKVLLLQIYRLHNVAREEKFDGPVHQNANLAFQPRQLGKIDSPPHEPGQQPGEAHRCAACPRQRQLGTGCLVSDDAKRAQRIEMKPAWLRTLDLGLDVPRKRHRLAECELRGRRARFARFCIGYRCTIAQRPYTGIAGDGQRLVDNHGPSLIFFHWK